MVGKTEMDLTEIGTFKDGTVDHCAEGKIAKWFLEKISLF